MKVNFQKTIKYAGLLCLVAFVSVLIPMQARAASYTVEIIYPYYGQYEKDIYTFDCTGPVYGYINPNNGNRLDFYFGGATSNAFMEYFRCNSPDGNFNRIGKLSNAVPGGLKYYESNYFSSTCYIFSSYAALQAYINNGDLDGCLNCPYLATRELSFALYGFSKGSANNNYVWQGVTLDGTTKFGGNEFYKLSDIYVDVYVGLIDSSGNHREERDPSSFGVIPPLASPMLDTVPLSDNKYNFVMPSVTGLRVSYVKFVPRFPDLAGEARFVHGVASYAYFDKAGNFESYAGHFQYNELNVPDSDLVNSYIDADSYLSHIDTKYDWLDALVNSMVDGINFLLKVLYRIRDFFWNKEGTGLLNYTARIAYMINWEHIKEYFGDSISGFFRGGLFYDLENDTGDMSEFLQNELSLMRQKFPNWAKVERMAADINGIFGGLIGVAPSFTFNLSQTSFSKFGVSDVSINFSWFEPYRVYWLGVINAFLWIRFLVSQFFSIKSLFNATSSGSDAIRYYGGVIE